MNCHISLIMQQMKNFFLLIVSLIPSLLYAQEKGGTQAYSRFDFTAGDTVVYANNFESDIRGEMPAGWSSNGSAETILFAQRNWVKLLQNATFITDNTMRFGSHFTVEFDLYLDFTYRDALFPSFSFGLLASGTNRPNSFEVLTNILQKDLLAVDVGVGMEENSYTKLLSLHRGTDYVNTGERPFRPLEGMLKKPIRVSMQVEGPRFRIWFNEHKLYDVSEAIPAGASLDQLFFRVFESSYANDQIGIYVSDIKVAKGIPDIRKQFMTAGRFSTTGILFDVNADRVRNESYGILRQVADLMQSQPGMKLQVIGHTDADGSEEDNLRLSRQRSESVKQFLVNRFGIDAARIHTDGKGESQPLADNKTKEGRAKNRRVEFVKL